MFDWEKINRDTEGKVILLYRHQRILDEKIVVSGMDVLDLGGWGMLATKLIEENINCVILDNFSEDQYYPERVRKLPHIVGDILELEFFIIEYWDVVTCFEMLEHCKDQQQAIYNIHRLLKPGGCLVGTFPIPGRVHAVDDPDVTFLNTAQLSNIIAEAGFTDIEIEPTGSIIKEEEPSSLYFKAYKSIGKVK